LVKIADAVDRAVAKRALYGTNGMAPGRLLAEGEGWAVHDVVCASGPADRPYEERHSMVSIAIVAAGTFQYRSTTGRALMIPGSFMLGNAEECFECGHEHGTGDRCIAFRYAPDYFAQLASDAGASATARRFRVPRLPAQRASTPIVADACAALMGASDLAWDEIGVRLAARVARQVDGVSPTRTSVSPRMVERVTHSVRAIERDPSRHLTLRQMAADAEVSPYHFLRTFEQLTGVTPHQYVRRARLRMAAVRLLQEPAQVIDVAFDSGFGDLSNFNRSFRAEFGVSPRAYRQAGRRSSSRRMLEASISLSRAPKA
jgi:AraC family transcriptional regulator